LVYGAGLGRLVGGRVLLLTTTGRRTERPRTTSLQYEWIDGVVYVASVRGMDADWVANLVAHPQAAVRIGPCRLQADAIITTDPTEIADFIQTRLERRPLMVGALLCASGLGAHPTRARLEDYAMRLALVRLTPRPG
jgi:deazaflavin-dependent oxidoreductase (nitroreductase family)